MNMKVISGFSDSSKLWIFQANQTLSSEKSALVESTLQTFCANWTSHGASMKSTFWIEFDRFVLVALDESAAVVSGCGQDKLIHVFQDLGKTLGIDFFDRLQTIYMEANELKEARLHEFWGLRKANVISNDTLVFDNTVKNLGEWKTNWLVPFAKSWHADMWGE